MSFCPCSLLSGRSKWAPTSLANFGCGIANLDPPIVPMHFYRHPRAFKPLIYPIGSISMSVPNLHVLRVKYLGPTNYQGSRVKIISDRFKQSVTIPFDYAPNNVEDMAAAFLSKPVANADKTHAMAPFNIIGLSDGYVITDTFQPLKS